MVKASKQQGGAIDIAIGALLYRLTLWILGLFGRGTRRLVFRWRRALSPVVTAGLIWLVSAVWHWTFPEWAPLALALAVGGIVVAVLGPKLNDRWSAIVVRVIPAGLDKGRTDVLDRMIERVYFGSLWTAVGVYITVRAGLGPSDFTLWWWRSALLVFGGSWWFHRRIRTAGRADRIGRKWNRITDRDRCPDNLKAIAGSRIVETHGNNGTSIVKVRLTEALTVDSAHRMCRPLASYYRTRPGSVHCREDEHDASYVWFTFLPEDPFKGKNPHPGPAVGATSLRELGKRLTMGKMLDGSERTMSLADHIGVYGATNSGKSGFLHSIMRWLVPLTDTIIVGIDMANGATLGVWKKALALELARDLPSAAVVLERVLAFIEDRERQLGNQDDDDDADDFEPTDEEPWLFLIIDEYPDLIAAAKGAGMYDEKKQLSWEKHINNLMGRIGKKARKTGVRVITAAQNPTKPDMGSKEFQAQLRTIISLGLDSLQSRNLWGNLEKIGWSSVSLNNGQYIQKDSENTVPQRSKSWWVEKAERRRIAREAGEKLVKMAEPTAWMALTGMPGVTVELPKPERLDPFLRLFEDGPQTVPELIRASRSSRATVYRNLRRHETALRKLETGPDAGSYALRGDTSVPVVTPAPAGTHPRP